MYAEKTIALALSGGGIRAMVFHLGVLKALTENGLLEKVSKISTVSSTSINALTIDVARLSVPLVGDHHN
ncbi:MAG TPA: patatin-like phospholipase family protein, partial [Methylophilaceae bacterium]|nr:patatin-like phospholipase family protein [Methylophilaceae bacterium]